MTGKVRSPEKLSSEYLLSKFSVQRKSANRKYQSFALDVINQGPIWSQLKNQIYLGGDGFVERVQQHIKDQSADIQMPKNKKRAIAKSIAEYEKISENRNQAIVLACNSGTYSYQELGQYFGLHFIYVGRIVREGREWANN